MFVSMTLKTVELSAGSVQAARWVVFNNPEECAHGGGVIALCLSNRCGGKRGGNDGWLELPLQPAAVL